MNRRRITAMLVVVAAVSACAPSARATPSTNGHPASPSAANAKVAWTGCGHSFQCTSLRAPLDYAHPNDGRTVTLALMRLPATDRAHRIGSLLINPGGPGASGIEFLRQASLLFTSLNRRFDIVGFDPRGVGESTPIRCVSAAQMDAFIAVNPQPTTPAGIQAAIDASHQFASQCAARNPTTLTLVGTTSAARDMEVIRGALGDQGLTFLGFSYGSLLGATYAGLYPGHVRAMVLDGALDPALTQDQMSRAQAMGFEHNLDAFLADCGSRSLCAFYNAGQPGPALDVLLSGLQSHPLTVGQRSLGVGEAYLGILAALYSPQTWGLLATALHDAQTGNGAGLLVLADSYDERHADGTYSNEIDANVAINCDDGPAPGSIAHLEQLAVELQRVAPHFGTASAFGSLACDFWPIAPPRRSALTDTGATTILVIGGTDDPATPYAWAQGLTRELSKARLVTRTGNGHVSYDKSGCIRALVDAYLVAPANVPTPGTTCATD